MTSSVFSFAEIHYHHCILPKENKSLFQVATSDASELFNDWEVPLGSRDLLPFGLSMGAVAHKLVGLIDGAPETSVYSSLTGPIESLSILRRSLLFAELANLSYLSRIEAGMMVHRIGFPEIRYYDRDGAQAYIFANEYDTVVTCRGTEPNDWNDVKADLDLAKAMAETAGWVHRGFKREVDELWPRLEQALVNNTRTLWFCGHSLGAAMAAICAGRCKLSYIRSNPRALFTYGSPRVGNHRYVNHVQLEAYRWVNNNDIVTRVPPSWLGYRHKGQEVYLNAYGKIRRLTTWQRIKDRWRGFSRSIREGRIDFFDDHSISHYVTHIRGAVEEDEGVTLRPVTASAPFAHRWAA